MCIVTELCFQRILSTTGGHLPQSKGLPTAIAMSVLSTVNMPTMFKDLGEHMLDTTVTDNHTLKLIKTISIYYSKVRFYHLGKLYTDNMSSNKVRKKLTKLVLFEHQ